MPGHCWFSKLAARFAEHGAHVELIYSLDRTARVTATIGNRSGGVMFKDSSDVNRRNCAVILADLCEKLVGDQCSSDS